MREKVERKKRVFGVMLAGERLEAGMTQFELADASGACRSTLASWECGLNFPRIDSLVRLADALGKEVQIRFVEKEG